MYSIAIDCRFSGLNAGLGTYTRSIVTALVERDDPWTYILFVRSETDPWIASLPNADRRTIVVADVPHYSLQEQWTLPSLIRLSGCHLFFSPHFSVPLRCPVPFIATIHDLILHRFPGEASSLKRTAYRLVMQHTVRQARRILVQSQFVREDIRSIYGDAAANASVVPPGIHAAFAPRPPDQQRQILEQYGLRRPFLLYVGGSKSHKNLPALMQSFTAARLEGIDLVLTVPPPSGAPDIPHIRYLSGVPIDDLAALYSAALASVTATLSEGFYFPAIEAMACGCPVLATSVGSIPEACGGHALLVEPTVDALTEGMRTIVRDEAWRNESRRVVFREYARGFSWEQAGSIVAEIVQSVLWG